MKSPFPGMDPFLEQHWGDANTRLIVYICDAINEQLPYDLQARVEEGVAIDAEPSSRIVFPDVRVVDQPAQPFTVPVRSDASVAVAEPRVIPLPDERPAQRRIEIVEPGSGNRVVTAIELLSPANKTGETRRKAYREKQKQYLEGGVNLVEVDLVRTGSFILAVPDELLPFDCRTPYMVCIRRANRPTEAEIVPIPLREPLPNIPIPLRPADADVVLRLQPLLDECYRRGRYGSIDYDRPLHPAFGQEDQLWIGQLLGKCR